MALPLPADGNTSWGTTMRQVITAINNLNGAAPITVPGLRLWLRANSLSGTVDAAEVLAVADSGASGRDLTSVTGSAPTYRAAVLNAYPVLRFDGSNDFLTTAAGAGKYLLSDISWTAFAVLKPSGSGDRTIIGQESGTGAAQLTVSSAGKLNLNKAFTSVVGTGTSTLSTSVFSVAAFSFTSGTSWAAYLNGAADGSGSTSTTMTAAGTVAGQVGRRSTIEPLSGDIAELITYDGVLSDADRGSVTAYLGLKYGIAVV